MFEMLIHDTFRRFRDRDAGDAGIYLNSRTNGGVVNLRRLHAKTKVTQILVSELPGTIRGRLRLCGTLPPAHTETDGLFCHGRQTLWTHH